MDVSHFLTLSIWERSGAVYFERDDVGPSRADGIFVPNVEEYHLHRQTGGSKMNDNKMVIGVDTAKRVFQLHWVDKDTGEIVRVRRMCRGTRRIVHD